jgi:ribonuclease P protein component
VGLSNDASVARLSPLTDVQRIRHKAQFDAVLKAPPCVKTPHFALHLVERESAPEGLFPEEAAWLGVMLPKRWAKHAVTRNTLRRQIYAVGRDPATDLPHAAMVVRLRCGFSRQQFLSATSDALKRAARLELLHLLGAGLAARRSKGEHA